MLDNHISIMKPLIVVCVVKGYTLTRILQFLLLVAACCDGYVIIPSYQSYRVQKNRIISFDKSTFQSVKSNHHTNRVLPDSKHGYVYLQSNSNADNNNNIVQTRKSTDFEYQEMKIIFEVMQREKVVSSNRMDMNKANELNRYITKIVSDRSSNVRLTTKDQLYNTTWTMRYTTMNILPPDATIQLKFGIDKEYVTTQPESNPTMQYRLVFGSKTFGLNAINANSYWNFIPSTDTRNDNNGISLMYDSISMDAFGLKNLHLCFISNLFKGRINTIDTVYYDGIYWIEQQQQLDYNTNDSNADAFYTTATSDKLNVIWNVYRRVDDESLV
jgi:hypothetical protein